MRPAQIRATEGDRIASDFVRLLFDYLENQGIDAPALLGVPCPARDAGPTATYPLRQWRAMLELARIRLDDPQLGLHLGQTTTPSHFGMLGYLWLNSANLGEALTDEGKRSLLVYLQMLAKGARQIYSRSSPSNARTHLDGLLTSALSRTSWLFLKPAKIVRSAFPKKHERYPNCHQQHADPSPEGHTLAKERCSPEGSSYVAQSSDRNDKAYAVHRESAQEREERKRHHTDACPHPRLTKCAQSHPSDLQGMEADYLADALHGTRNAELSARPRRDNQSEKHEIEHANFSLPSHDSWLAGRCGSQQIHPGR